MATSAFAALTVFSVSARLGLELMKRAPKFSFFTPRVAYFKGGFDPSMTRIEAARILGIRQTAANIKITQAHRRLMLANHPDAGGSHYMATKINEAKEMLLKR
mmetsp:Transcript_27813/g.38677  ORF Transcript_27813/g.38677 Transcript_27813/m.38677 type:complete len:103 (-) Transcript_27813:130-438(-)